MTAERPPTRYGAGTDADALTSLEMSLRAPLFAAITTSVSTAGHLLGGGDLPSAETLTLLSMLVGISWRVLARREQSLTRLVIGVLAAETVIHAVLTGATSDHTHHGAAMTGSLLGLTVGCADPTVMMVAHAVAAFLVGGWLRGVESATWRFARRLLPAMPLRPVACVPFVPAALRPLPQWPEIVWHGLVGALVAHRHRGPPACAHSC